MHSLRNLETGIACLSWKTGNGIISIPHASYLIKIEFNFMLWLYL